MLSDFLIHLLDASQAEVLEFYHTTKKVLAELGADDKRTLLAFTKIDKIHDSTTLATLVSLPDALFLSVHTGEGLDELVERMAEMVGQGLSRWNRYPAQCRRFTGANSPRRPDFANYV